MAAAMRIRRQVAAPGRGQSPRSPQDLPAGARLIELPRRCLLTYDPSDCDPGLLALIGQVWGLQPDRRAGIAAGCQRCTAGACVTSRFASSKLLWCNKNVVWWKANTSLL
jgi:hypothetical protein